MSLNNLLIRQHNDVRHEAGRCPAFLLLLKKLGTESGT